MHRSLILAVVTVQGLLRTLWHCALLWMAAILIPALISVNAACAQQTGVGTDSKAVQSGAGGLSGSSGGATGMTPERAQMLEAYAGQKVASVELAGQLEVNEEELTPLLVQQAGEPFDPDKVERSLAAIKATGKFKDVQLSVVPAVDGVRVMLVLQPGLYFGIYEFPGSSR